MNHIARTYLVPQAFQVNAPHPDRRRKNRDARTFELEPADATVEPASRVEPQTDRTLSSGGDEGVGEYVNIVV